MCMREREKEREREREREREGKSERGVERYTNSDRRTRHAEAGRCADGHCKVVRKSSRVSPNHGKPNVQSLSQKVNCD